MKRVAITVGILGMVILLAAMVMAVVSPWQVSAGLLLFVSAFFPKLTKFVLDYTDKEKALKSRTVPRKIPVQKSLGKKMKRP